MNRAENFDFEQIYFSVILMSMMNRIYFSVSHKRNIEYYTFSTVECIIL